MRTEPRALTIGAAIALHLPTDQPSREISWLSAEHDSEAEAPRPPGRVTYRANGAARVDDRRRHRTPLAD